MFGHAISRGVEKRQAHPTDLTEQQWNRIEPLIPAVKPGGRPAKYQRREIVSAIFYQMRGGAAWRMLPHYLPPWKVSSLGQMPFFIEFLKTSGLFDGWVKDCPLRYTSPNAPKKRDLFYADYARELKQDFPSTAAVFDGMRQEESSHRRRLIELFREKFGDRIPPVRR
jgi:transposase